MIDDHPSVTMEKWKERKNLMEYQNDRSLPYRGMSVNAIKIRTSVLNRIWRDHTSDKYGFRGHKPPYVRRPFTAVHEICLFLR